MAADVAGQLAQQWRRTQTSPVRVGLVAAVGAFAALVLVAGVLAVGVVQIAADQLEGGGDEQFVSGLFGTLVVFVTKYFVYAFNWLPVHVDLFAGVGGAGARQEMTVHAALVTGMPAVALVMHRAGLWAARHTTPMPSERVALTQGAALGVGYAVLLVLFATAAAGELNLRVAIFEGRAALGPNRLFALVVASVLGTLFACWGTVSATGGRPWPVLTRYARDRLDWLVAVVAAGTAWLAGQVVACVVGGAWLVQQLVTEPSVRIGESSEGLSRLAVLVGSIVYSLNLTTILVLRGMGVPLREVDGDTSEAVALSPLLQLGATLVAVAVLVLAGYLAQAAVRRRFETLRMVTRVAVSFAVLATLLSRVALVRVEAGGETGGTTASLAWVFLISLVEAAVLGMVGARLATSASLPIERVPVLRWFAGPVFPSEPAEVEADMAPPPRRDSKRTAAIASLVVVPLLLVTVVPAVAGRQSPTEAVRRYLEHVDARDADAAADDVLVPDGAATLVSADAVAAMVRENPLDVSDVRIDGTRTSEGKTFVDATFKEGGRDVRRSFEVAKAKDRRRFGLWPVWVVVLPTARLSIDVPSGAGAVTIDGLRVANARAGDTATVEVFDGAHRLRVAGSALLDAFDRRVDTTRERRVTVQPRLSNRGREAVREAVRQYFEQCAKSTSMRTVGCPQSVFPRGSEQQNVRWSLQGDPAADLEPELDSDGFVPARGSYRMAVEYDWTSPGFFGPPETGHERDEDSGTYYLRFALDGEGVKLVDRDVF